jgi:hypothetical protein
VHIIKSRTRVEAATRHEDDVHIARETEDRIEFYRDRPRADILRRLKAIDEEWDIERALEAAASSAALVTLGLGKLVHRRFYALTGVVSAFLLQHAVQGWCPPLPALRRMGFRTPREIEAERRALEWFLRDGRR